MAHAIAAVRALENSLRKTGKTGKKVGDRGTQGETGGWRALGVGVELVQVVPRLLGEA